MKKIIVLYILFSAVTVCLHGQKTEKFFDHQWIESSPDMARFYVVIIHTDSGWVRQDYFLAEKNYR